MARAGELSDADYELLLLVRTRLREFSRWSADRAAEAGLSATQHQLLLAIRGHADHRGPAVGDVAGYLLIKHNTAVELVDRCEKQGLVRRVRDADDQRVVRLSLTADARRRLRELSGAHLDELSSLLPLLQSLVAQLRAGE